MVVNDAVEFLTTILHGIISSEEGWSLDQQPISVPGLIVLDLKTKTPRASAIIMGRGGQNIQAIRRLLGAFCAIHDVTVFLNFKPIDKETLNGPQARPDCP